MILYSTVGTSNLERAIKFYDAVFGALGVSRAPNWTDGWAGWGGCRLSTPSHWSTAAVMKGLPARVHITSRRFMSRMYATRTETNLLASTTSTSHNLSSMTTEDSGPFRIYRRLSPSSGSVWG